MGSNVSPTLLAESEVRGKRLAPGPVGAGRVFAGPDLALRPARGEGPCHPLLGERL